ncbi:hypothetical protein NW759_001493 [Fusarium solani]|nr:hypothetical protein NW759_001493 [Fusarium solani]
MAEYDHIDYPKPPKAEHGKPAPQCPYCYKVLESSDLSQPAWNDHLLRLAFDSSDELEKNARQTSPAFSSEEIEAGSGRHASSLHFDNPSNEGEFTVAEGRSLEQDEPNVSEAIDMPVEHNPVAANERDGCCDMALERGNNDSSSTPSSTRNLESCKSRQDTCAEAETVHQKAMQLRFRSSSSERPESLSSMVKTAKEPLEQRKYQEPEEEYCKAPELHANALGASSPCNISIKGSRANALVRQGEIEEAEKIYQEILDLSTEALGEVHPHRLSCRSNLAGILEKKGEYAEAEAVYRDVWELRRRTLKDDHPDTLASYNKLANALARLKRFDEAVLVYKEALETRREVLGAKHSDTINTLGNLANSLQNQGQYDEAKEMYRDSKSLGREVLESNHPHLRWIRARLKEVAKDGEEW